MKLSVHSAGVWGFGSPSFYFERGGGFGSGQESKARVVMTSEQNMARR